MIGGCIERTAPQAPSKWVERPSAGPPLGGWCAGPRDGRRSPLPSRSPVRACFAARGFRVCRCSPGRRARRGTAVRDSRTRTVRARPITHKRKRSGAHRHGRANRAVWVPAAGRAATLAARHRRCAPLRASPARRRSARGTRAARGTAHASATRRRPPPGRKREHGSAVELRHGAGMRMPPHAPGHAAGILVRERRRRPDGLDRRAAGAERDNRPEPGRGRRRPCARCPRAAAGEGSRPWRTRGRVRRRPAPSAGRPAYVGPSARPRGAIGPYGPRMWRATMQPGATAPPPGGRTSRHREGGAA
jgi:hypothetical protein